MFRKKVVLSIRKAKSLREKVVGLIGQPQPFSLFIQTRFGIHTFGVRFPIDVIILDGKNTIVALRKNLKPNRVFVWNPMYNIVLELPSGTIEKSKLKIGSIVSLKEDK